VLGSTGTISGRYVTPLALRFVHWLNRYAEANVLTMEHLDAECWLTLATNYFAAAAARPREV